MDAVLLDDDPLVHMMWKLAAKKAGKSLIAFSKVADLRAQALTLPKSTPIYLDSDLGPEGRGEVIAQELRAQGFTELYLVTGYEPGQFAHLTWLKGVLGKGAPWGG
jgi:hypothetical protein